MRRPLMRTVDRLKGELRLIPGRFAEIFYQNWGSKAIALILASIVFVVTRDEVVRLFTLPLHVVSDPERVLLTDLPKTVDVELRGPWARINRIQPRDLGEVGLDLRDADPGPLELDPASVVMPEGVVLNRLDYSAVDLRFDPVIEAEVAIEARIVGEVHPDFEKVGIKVEPKRWKVHGAKGLLSDLDRLELDLFDVSNLSETVERKVHVRRLPRGLSFVGLNEGERPEILLRVELRPRMSELHLRIPLRRLLSHTLRKIGAGATVMVDEQRVVLKGPRMDLRAINELDRPLIAEFELPSSLGAAKDGGGSSGTGSGGGGTFDVDVRFSWSPSVAVEVQERVKYEPSSTEIKIRVDQAESPLEQK